MRQAVELNPNYAFAHQVLAFVLTFQGRHNEAIVEVKLARKLDPISPRICANVGWLLYFARWYDEAIEELQKAMQVEPRHAAIYDYLGLAYLQKKEYGKAIAASNQARSLTEQMHIAFRLGSGLAASGRRSEALDLAAELRERSKREYVSQYELSKLHLSLSDREQALRLLQDAFEARDPRMMHIKVDPELDPLRSEPRFQELLRRMNFPE